MTFLVRPCKRFRGLLLIFDLQSLFPDLLSLEHPLTSELLLIIFMKAIFDYYTYKPNAILGL